MGISLPGLPRETMKAFILACVAIAAVSADGEADAYTIAQVRAGIPALKSAYDGQTRIITGVSGNGVVSGHLGLAGPYAAYNGINAYNGLNGYNAYNTYNTYSPFTGHLIGKREADSDADAYTIGQVYNGLPFANAVATGHAHNPGYVAYTSQSAYPAVGYNVYNGFNGYNGFSGYNRAYLGS